MVNFSKKTAFGLNKRLKLKLGPYDVGKYIWNDVNVTFNIRLGCDSTSRMVINTLGWSSL